MNAPATVANFRLVAALEYADRGWHVIPLHHPLISASGAVKCSCGIAGCTSIGKHPTTKNGLKNASTVADVIREWWADAPAANIGIVTGAESGIVVVDVDTKGGGPASLELLKGRYGQLPSSIEAITGSGGMHLYFKHPGYPVPNSAGRLGPGLDVRGDGGYVVAAPSLHAKGERYTWDFCAGPDEASLAELPEWLAGLMVKRPPATTTAPTNNPGDAARHWLGKALARAIEGNRNDTGLWLACQLRDHGVSRSEAESTMRAYAERAPRGETAYTEQEAQRTLAEAYNCPPRQPAESPNRRNRDIASPAMDPVREAVTAPAKSGAGSALRSYIGDVIDGKIYDAKWPWAWMTTATQSLLPGSFCLIGGDPGVGKTYFVLQCLTYWYGTGMNPAAFFAECSREFYTMRLLGQAEGNWNFGNHEWIKQHPVEVNAALDRHEKFVDEIGQCFWVKPAGKLTQEHILAWIRDRAQEGRRVIVIDPITAVDPGAERWSKDSDFVVTVNDIMEQHKCSIVMVTHPKQMSGRQGGTASGHDAAGGAAYFRFTHAMIWLTRSKQPRRVMARHALAGSCIAKTSYFFRYLKARNGMGAGWEVAYDFVGAKFSELGVVQKELKDKSDDLPPTVDPFPTRVPAPAHQQQLDLDDL